MITEETEEDIIDYLQEEIRKEIDLSIIRDMDFVIRNKSRKSRNAHRKVWRLLKETGKS